MKTQINPRTFTRLTNGIAQRASIFIAALFCFLLLSVFASTADAITSNGTGGGLWSSTTTWTGGVVPAPADDVVIADGDTVTIDTAALCNNLTVGQGSSGVLQYQDTATARSLTAAGSVTLANNGTFIAFPTPTVTGSHTLSIGQNLANSGVINFNVVSGAFTSSVQITFTGAGTTTWTGNGNTNLKQTTGVSLNKGTSNANTLDFTPGTGTFTVLGANAVGFLSITNGTFKISGPNAFSNPVFNANAYSVPATGGIWMNNANATIVGLGASPTMSGLLRMTAGTYNVGTSSGNAMGGATTSNFIIEGGTMNFSGRLLVTSGSAQFNMSAGTINVNTVGNAASTSPSFGFTSTSFFTMSGGTINLVQACTGATPQDYQVSSTAFITGGTVNVGTAATATNFVFRIQGQMPNVVIDNTTNNKSANLSAQTNVWGNLTINTGTTLNLNPGTAQTLLMIGSTITNNGAIIVNTTNTGSVNFAGGLQLTASGGSGTAQTYMGTGTFGTAVNTIASLSLQNGAGVTLDAGVSNLNVQRVNLFFGSVTNSNKIALGNGGASVEIIQRGVGGNPTVAGSFDVAPTFNIGTGGLTLVYAQSATGVYSTGVEIPGSRSILSIQLVNPGGLNLTGGALTATGASNALVLAGGTLNTSAANLLTLSGTAVAAISGGNATTYVNGPLARVLPASLVSGSTYTFPVGKSSFKMLELVNPTTNAGGTVTIHTEVFDADSGGTGGTGFSDIMHNRYWSAAITVGAANFTNTTVRLTEAANTGVHAIGQSATQGGAYDSIGGTVAPPVIGPSSATTSLGFFALGILTGAPTINGSSTVGTGGTFTTLTSAVAALNTRLITGPVTLTLTDNAYAGETFPITISPNTGASATNTITIKPAAGATPAFSGSSASALIIINGADYVTIDGSNTVGGTTRDMTLTNTSTSTSSAVIWGQTVTTNDPATNNIVKNLNIVGNASTTTVAGIGFGSSTISTASLGTRNDNNRVQNNSVAGAQFGVYSVGASAVNKDIGTVITGNTVGGAGALAVTRGIFVGFNDGVQITNNTVSGVNPAGSVDCIGIAVGANSISTTAFAGTAEVVNAVITGNVIGSVVKTDTFSAGGIVYFTPTYGTTRIANNSIYGVNANGTSGDFAAGIFVGGSQNATTQLYYNSVSMTGSRDTGGAPTSPSYALCILGQNPLIDARDNILFNTQTSVTVASTSYAIGLSSLSPFTNITSNYNDLFTSGSNSAFSRIGSLVQGPVLLPATDLTTFTAWKTTTGKDTNSVSGNPQFLSTTNLHINPAVGTLVESGGTNIAGITTDIDNDIRQGNPGYLGTGTAPDIGSDEGEFTVVVANDMSATAFIDPTNGGSKLAGVAFSPQASFTNNGTATQTSVTVRYRILDPLSVEVYNNTQVIASIASGVTTPVTFASVVGGLSAGTYTIKAKAELVGDTVPANDEITGTVVVEAPLNGTYTVGAAGTYSTLTQAVGKLNSLGITGPVTLTLLDANNTTSPENTGEVFPIVINAISGASSTNTITIKPATGVTTAITGSSASALIVLNGSDFVTIDGSNNGSSSRDMTMTNTNTGTSSALLWMQTTAGSDAATQNTVKNVNLVGTSTTAAAGTLIGVGSGSSAISITSTGTGNNNNTFQNNNITKTSYGVYSGGASAANKNTGTIITQNVMNAVSPNNIVIGGILVKFDNGVQVTKNAISEISFSGAFGSPTFGIALGVTPSNTFTTFTGSDVINAVVTGNSIGTVKHIGTGSSYGVVVNSVTSGTTLVSNNMISGVGIGSNPTPSDFIAGILAGGGTGSTTQIYFNSVAMSGNEPGTLASPSYALAIAPGNPIIDVKNNIFFNTQTNVGGTGKHYAIANASTTFTNMTSSYNDFFVSGASSFIGQTAALGASGTDQLTLGDWNTATGQDASPNSISADPGFISAATNLHITTASPAWDTGSTIGSITVDFDGNTRPQFAAYDIGADEVLNTAPTIAAVGVNRQQGSPASNSTIANVNDTETGPGSVTVTVTSANPSNGVTISNIVNTAGVVTADVVASCSATTATFTLQASDGFLTATDTLTVTVTANSAPTLTYNNAPVAYNGSTSVNPATGPSDNGSVSTIVVQSVGTYTGTISVDNVTGIVSISNATPAGAHTITIRATDNCGAITDATFTLTVGSAAAITVTPAVTPTASDNDYTRINNAVQSIAASGTITLSGTFDWTEANAAASWALGSDGIASTVDDYSIMVPANLNGVTFTATSLGAGTIQGPGDLPGVELEGVFFFNGGDNQGWTISNIRFLDFDLSIGMFAGAGGLDAFNNTHITNNYIRMARDVATATDTAQNIGIAYSLGTNQVISGNTIDIQGDGVSIVGNNAADVGIQGETNGGNVYDGLQITNNTIHVLNAQPAAGVGSVGLPEVIIGIWENGHAHSSNITISGNSFTNLAVGNNPATNLQRGFRLTSHSSATTTVAYSNNTVSGANIGFQWLAAQTFGGNQPIQLTGNTLTGNQTGVLVQSQGQANLTVNTITGNGTGSIGVRAITGLTTVDMARTTISAAGNAVVVDATSSGANPVTMRITNSTLSGNTAATGGGISGTGTGGIASITVTNSTLSGNSAGGASILLQDATLTVGNSIFRPGNGGTNISALGSSVVTSLGYNLSSDGFGSFLTGTGDQINTDPILGPLKNNGGPTFTHAPLSNSPAIDRGKDLGPISPYPATGVDQRGSLRPVTYSLAITPPAGGDRSDIGAVELPPGVQPTSAVSRKIHGAAGPFDFNLPLTGLVGVECRSGGGTNAYTVILNFANPVTYISAAVTNGTGIVATDTGNGTNQITLDLTGVTDIQRITLALFGATDTVTLNSGDVGLRMGVLIGDTNNDTTVSASDVGQTKAVSGQVTTGSNFREDVTVSGSINASDVGLVKSKSGNGLPLSPL